MSQPPNTLPEENPTPRRKPKDDYYEQYVVRKRSRGAGTALLALVTGLALGVLSVIALLIYQPATIEAILNVPLLSGTERAFDQTALAVQGRATQSAAELLGTQAALGTREAVLNQEATQNAFSLAATRTAINIESVQRATQAAFYLQSTQAAIYLFATQIQLDTLQQQARAEIYQTATQLAVNAAAAQGQLSIDFANTQAAQERQLTATATAGAP